MNIKQKYVTVMKNVSHYHYHHLTQACDHNIYIINFWHLKLSILSVRYTSSMLLQALCIISYPSVNSNLSCIRKRSIQVKIDNFLSRVTWKFDGWPWKTIGRLFFATSSFVHHFVAIGEFKLELQSRNAQSGSNLMIFYLRDLDLWPLTLTFCMDITLVHGHHFGHW